MTKYLFNHINKVFTGDLSRVTNGGYFMDQALWLSTIFGPVFVILGLWILIRTEEATKFVYSVKATPAALYLGGMLNLIIGCAVLSLYSDWSWSLAVLVTLLGYLQVVRALLIFFVTEWTLGLWQMIADESSLLRSFSIIPIIWGLLLSWFAYSY